MAAEERDRLRVHSSNRERHRSTPQLKSKLAPKKKSVFPETPTMSGELQITKKVDGRKPKWKKRYFCLKHNFLLSAPKQDSEKLERVISLDQATITSLQFGTNYGIQIQTNRKTYLLKADNQSMRDVWLDPLITATSLQITDLYECGEHLGVSETQNTTVVAGVCYSTNRRVAIKIVDKRTCDHHLLANEVKILKKLAHEHVVQLYDIFETPDILYLIMERLEGGELFERITAHGEGFHYSEKKVCDIVRQIAHGVRYMHRSGIVHRDLKPENILCTTDTVDTVKVADFGISKCLQQQEEFMRTMCGTISYTAPEVIQGCKYGKEVDYWSIGVIMYILLCGYPPFYGESDFDIAASIVSKDEVEMPEEEWAHVSQEGRDVVRKLLSRDPKKRMTLDELIEHAWKNGAEVRRQQLQGARSALHDTVAKRRKARISRTDGFPVSTGWIEASGFNMNELTAMANQTASEQNVRRRQVSYGGYIEQEDDDVEIAKHHQKRTFG